MTYSEALARLAAPELPPPSWPQTFAPETIDDLPAAARRMLNHAIRPGAAVARRARLDLSGSVVQGGRRLGLRAREILRPGLGFVWEAKASLGPLSIQVRDHYLDNDGAVEVRALGVLPMTGEAGPDTAASSRGRLAAETFWVPTMLLPVAGARWEALDDNHARAHVEIDGLPESFTLTVDADGAVEEITMLRWGRVGVSEHQPIPYGFRVLAERTFGKHTIGTEVEGGWWYGTDRYTPETASRFRVEDATFV